MSICIVRAAALAGASLAFLSSAALAQIEVVTVTAEKRNEDIQTVPIAVTALSGNQLRAAQVHDFNDLQQIAPSLLVSTGTGDSTGGLVRIRGVGTTGNNNGLEASVGVFVDGVYRSRSAAALEELLAIDRIEVLRGPQGTLFGKNTTSGAISIISTKPTQDFYANLSASGGTYGSYRFIGELNAGLTDTLAVNLAGLVSHRDGFLTDVNDGHKSNGQNHYSLKGQALWTPTSSIEVRIIADYAQKADSSSDATYAVYSARTRLIQDVLQSPASVNFGRHFPNAVTIPNSGNTLQYVDYGDYRIATNFPRVADVNDWGISGQIDWTLSDHVSLTSISSYRDFNSHDFRDTDYTPADIIRGQDDTELRNITQELQLKGSWGGLDWLVGGFYSDEAITYQNRSRFGSDAALYIAHIFNPAAPIGTSGGSQTDACILGDAVNASPACVLFGLTALHPRIWQAGDGVNWNWRQHGNSFSAFTHNVYHLNEQWSVTLGARYSSEIKHGQFDGGTPVWHDPVAQKVACGTTNPPAASNAVVGSLAIFCNRTPYNQKLSSSSLTGTANISWKPNARLMFYASYSRGFKAGAFNLDPAWANNPAVTTPTARPEYDDNFELGARSTLMDGRAIVNLTLFHEKFSDFQINRFDGLNFSLANLRHAYSDGVELETIFEPEDGLTLTESLSYTFAHYGSDIGPTPGVPAGAPIQLAGQRLTQAPMWTNNSGITYAVPLGFLWNADGFVSLNANYRSSYNTGSDLNVNKRQGAFVTVNGQIGIRSPDDLWSLALYGRNIFNAHYNVVAFALPTEQSNAGLSSTNAIGVFPGEPAIYGVTLTLHH
ncbi:MAG: TonB-dependent receptor [Rhizomicrobium sp.]